MSARAVSSIADALTDVLGVRFEETARRPVSGGSINRCFEYRSASGSVFVKVSSASNAAEMLQAEAAGLKALAAADAVRVPRVIVQGRCGEGAYLALEWITLCKSTR